jgi:hypothetical protein
LAVNEIPSEIDAEALRSVFARAHANSEALEQAWDGLLAEHEGQWVGSHAGNFVFADSPQGVVNRATAEGWPLDALALRHLLRVRPAILL